MRNYSIYLLIQPLAALLFGPVLFGQTVVTLEPFYGIQQRFSFIKDQSNGHPDFNTNVFGIGVQLGVLTTLQYNHLPKITIGFMAAEAGTSGRLKMAVISQNPYLAFNSTHISGSTVYKFPFLISYPIKKVSWIALRGKTGVSFRYLLNVRIEPFAGLSFDRLQSKGSGYSYSIWRSPQGDTLKYETDQTYHNNQNNGSLLLGVKLQFVRKAKPFFSLNFSYNQGIINYFDTDYISFVKGHWYNTVVGTRGSFTAITLSYPITVYHSAKRKQVNLFTK